MVLWEWWYVTGSTSQTVSRAKLYIFVDSLDSIDSVNCKLELYIGYPVGFTAHSSGLHTLSLQY